tara:strand:+ start:195 stop:482 length:288 start_codon:yes stop_codon:yes gene_type:complete
MPTNFTIGMNGNQKPFRAKANPAKAPSPDGEKIGQIKNFKYKSLPQLMSYRGSGEVPPLDKLNLLTGKNTASKSKGYTNKGYTSKGYTSKGSRGK